MSTGAPTRSPALRGAAFGVSILAFFAVGWLGWGTGGHLPVVAQICVTAAAVLISVVLAVLAWRRWRTTTPPQSGTPSTGRPFGRHFGLIIAAEWIGLAAVAAVLGATGHTDPIPAVVCAGVGLHFIPLAQLFGVRAYYFTAIGMCLLTVATFALAPSTPPLWTLLPGLGSALILYATCAVLLTWSPPTGTT